MTALPERPLLSVLCRCCAYRRIMRAVGRAAELFHELAEPAPLPLLELELGRPARPWDLQPARERDWFAVLSDGLVIAIEPERVGETR